MADYQDEVKHKLNDIVGTVIATYELDGRQYFDVRVDEQRIYYKTIAANWETTVAVDE